jgi:hypothetical protein
MTVADRRPCGSEDFPIPGMNFILRRFELNCALAAWCVSDKPVEQRAQAAYE